MKQILKSYFIFFICFINVQLIAQDKLLDSLKYLLKNATNDKVRCNLLIDLSNASTEKDWLNYVDEAIIISEKNLNNLNANKNDIDEFKKCYASALILKAGELETHGNIPVSINLYFKSLKIYEEINDTYGCYAGYASLSNFYNNINEQRKAIEFANKSLEKSIKLKDQTAMSTSFNLLGNAYRQLKDYPKALNYYRKMLEISIKINNQKYIATTYSNIGFIYKITEKYDTALFYLYKGLEIKNTIQDVERMPNSLNSIASIYIDKNEYSKALTFALKGLLIAKESSNAEQIKSSANNLYLIYKKTGKYKLAIENYELFIKMRDSLSNQDTRKASIRSELKYEYEKKAAADSVKVAEEKKLTTVKLKQGQTQRYFLYGGLGLTILFVIFIFNRFRVTQKQKNIIEEQKIIVEHQKGIVDEKQKEILDSINYASKIQKALLPNEKYFERNLNKFKNV